MCCESRRIDHLVCITVIICTEGFHAVSVCDVPSVEKQSAAHFYLRLKQRLKQSEIKKVSFCRVCLFGTKLSQSVFVCEVEVEPERRPWKHLVDR